MQLDPFATFAPQLLDSLNWPEAEIPDTARLAVPVFDNVTLCAVLVVPIFWLANVRLAGETLATGEVVAVVAVLLELPPPHAAIPATSAKVAKAKAKLHRCSFPLMLTSNAARKRPKARVTSAPVAHGLFASGRLAGPIIPAAVVVTVTVTGTLVVVEVNVTEAGLKLHLAPVGKPEHAKLTVPVNPPVATSVTLIVPEAPGLDIVIAGLVDAR